MGARASRQIKRDNCLLTQVKRGVAAPARPLTRLAGPGRRQKINLKRVLSPPDLPRRYPRQTRIADRYRGNRPRLATKTDRPDTIRVGGRPRAGRGAGRAGGHESITNLIRPLGGRTARAPERKRGPGTVAAAGRRAGRAGRRLRARRDVTGFRSWRNASAAGTARAWSGPALP